MFSMRQRLPVPLPSSDRHRLPLKAAQNKQTPIPPPACPSHVSFFWVTGFVAEQEALHFSLCFQKRQAPHCLTCIGKLWLAACSAKVCDLSTSKVSTTCLESTFAVAAVPGSLALPSSEDSLELFPVAEPSSSVSAALEGIFPVALVSGLLSSTSPSPSPAAEEESGSGELDEVSESEEASLVTVAAAEGSLLASDSKEAAILLGLSSADSSSDAATDWLSEPSSAGSEEAFSVAVAAAEEPALGGELATSPSLDDMAPWASDKKPMATGARAENNTVWMSSGIRNSAMISI